MKRLVFILFATLLMAGNTFAQNKPAKGSWSTEVQINPFDQDGETFSLDGLKVRYFLSDKDAIRLKVGFKTTNSKFTDEDSQEETDYTSSHDNQFKYKKGSFDIDFGYERHFDLGKRLDAYLGGSLGFGKNFASTNIDKYFIREGSYTASTFEKVKYKYEETETGKIKNGAITDKSTGFNLDNAERATWNINAAVFAGLEFYIYKGLYIGTELGINCQSQKTLKMEYDGSIIKKTTTNGQTDVKEESFDDETTDNQRVTNFKTYIEPRLRIGITF